MSSRPNAATVAATARLLSSSRLTSPAIAVDLVAEPSPQLLAAVGDAVHDRDAGALLDIALDNGAADARAAAGDQRHLPVEPSHGAILLLAVNRAPVDPVSLPCAAPVRTGHYFPNSKLVTTTSWGSVFGGGLKPFTASP